MSTCSVVVISYNGKEFLRETLRAIEKSEAKPLEVIVVDDASTDGTYEMAQVEFPWAVLLRNEKNSGTSVSRNRGAQEANGDYIIFLDNDITIQPATFGTLVTFLDTHADAGIVTAQLFSEDGSQRRWNIGYDMNNFRGMIGGMLGTLRLKFPKSRVLKHIYEKFELNLWAHDEVRAVDWVIEECFAIRRPLFESLGGFDEHFFMYHEGPDLCVRVRQAGYRVYFTPHARAVVREGHAHSDAARTHFFRASKYYYYRKHYFYLKSNPIFFWMVEGIGSFLYLLKKRFVLRANDKTRHPGL